MPETVQMERGLFAGCTAMEDENGFIVFRGNLYGYVGKAENVTLPAGSTRVRMGALAGKDNLKSIVFSKDTIEIEERAVIFYNNLRGVGIYPATEKFHRKYLGLHM